MAVLGFTTVGSLLKDQTELAKNKGIETFGVTMIDDSDGKHDKVTASNAQLHLFMQLKRGNVTHLLFQSRQSCSSPTSRHITARRRPILYCPRYRSWPSEMPLDTFREGVSSAPNSRHLMTVYKHWHNVKL